MIEELPKISAQELFEEEIQEIIVVLIKAIDECSSCCLDNHEDIEILISIVEQRLRKHYGIGNNESRE